MFKSLTAHQILQIPVPGRAGDLLTDESTLRSTERGQRDAENPILSPDYFFIMMVYVNAQTIYILSLYTFHN